MFFGVMNEFLNGIIGDIADVCSTTLSEIYYGATSSSAFMGTGTVNLKFDSYITHLDELAVGGLRLLETDIPLILPAKTHIRFLVTSNDVIHSFAVPSLGIKVDAVPGRISAVPVYISQVGRFTGQCSEICGTGHGFMPIYIVAVKPATFWYFMSC